MLEAAFRPGDPVAVVALLKHPLLRLGLERTSVRHAAETIELVALRGGTGRPDIAELRRVRGAACRRRRPASPSGSRASTDAASRTRSTC